MSDMPWIDTYVPHNWTTFQLPTKSPVRPSIIDVMGEFDVCGAESDFAANAYKAAKSRGGTSPNFFFFDLEQIAVDHDVFGLSRVGRLTTEWNGYPAGSLVMVTYEGVSEEDLSSSQLTYFVDNS